MKPIIVDMKDMSDSAEVYESRPHPFLVIFIYLILSMVIVALAWIYFSKIDIVVTSQGIIRLEQNNQTVTNIVAGEVEEWNIIDGQSISEGDVLYTMNHKESDKQLEEYESTLSDTDDRIDMINAYLKLLEDNDDGDFESLLDNQYYSEFKTRKELLEANYDSVDIDSDAKKSQYSQNIKSIESSLEYYNQELDNLHKMIDYIKTRENKFTRDEMYYYTAMESYIINYKTTESQYDKKIKNLEEAKEKLESESEEESKEEEVFIVPKDRISVAKSNQFQKNTKTQLQSNQDVSSQIQLQSNQDTQLQSNQNISTQSQQSQNIYSDNDDNLQTYPVASQSQYSVEDIQNQIDECKEEKEKALEKLEIDQNVSVAQQIKNIEETIKNLENNLSEAENNWNNLSEDNIEISQSKVKYSEISTMYSELNTYQSKKTEIESNIKSLYSNIDNSTITANQSGVVNIKKEYVVGDYIEAGVEVLNIVPQDSSKYIVEIYIANSDIGKLREDMDVKYELTAFPSSEYGNVTGEILAISKDIKANADNNAYYIAKASIDTTTFYDRNGEENTLKVGMACQAKLVIDRRRILFYILEKLNLLKNSL